ncbi:cryptochrome/photolyase family protein [Haloplanus halophilus]|uniref:cryptochrome/photolyase family protein n=1 Tax=Haloplanus halophilus TaxID=2949993 RepID=UPI002041B0FF|nr:cryptochrome/photolyase family protein [Haloplanus sp. GDY1]
MTVWLLGDQLHPEHHVLDGADRVLVIEAAAFADRRPYHPQKLGLVFAAMRHARDRLREAGYAVDYRRAETFGDALDEHFTARPGDDLRCMRPPSHGAADRLRELVAARGGTLSVVHDDRFLCSPEAFDEWHEGEGFRHEDCYRWLRRREDVLMDGSTPAGGEWNYDESNRETPPADWSPPPVPRYEPDGLTRETLDWVAERFDTWGELAGFAWPVTRAEALDALDHFVEHRLAEFGPYQDAMVGGECALAHSLLSSSLNLGLLGPREVIDAAVAAYERDEAPIESVEGFVRQVLGWREFLRHAYRRTMPDLTERDLLDRSRDLPPLYYDAETDMRCLSEAVGHVHDHGYAHHIERLMLLANFALIYGADPHELNEWFHFGFVDAYHWVTAPNVLGMGTFATDAFTSKPYASSGNYVDRMSDHCADCPYDVDSTTGAGACPFNALYWDFLDRNETRLRGTGRMGLMYAHVDRKSASERAEISERARTVRRLAREGRL